LSQTSLSGSFSVGISIAGLLIGMALQGGKIKSIDQPVPDFLPTFSGGGKDSVRIRHLLTMSSETDVSQSYIHPISITAEECDGSSLEGAALGAEMAMVPGTIFGGLDVAHLGKDPATSLRYLQHASIRHLPGEHQHAGASRDS
jgi:CubicO group peptidase (beta-lactamase class C family)